MAENKLLEKLEDLKAKYASLQQQLADPELIADMKRFVQVNKEYKELEPIMAAGAEYRRQVDSLDIAKDILLNEKDPDLREMAKAEAAEIEERLPKMEEDIKLLLIPADPEDDKNAILEIRGGTGGDEAANFCRRPFPYVRQILREEGMENGGQQQQRRRYGRLQRGCVQDFRR